MDEEGTVPVALIATVLTAGEGSAVAETAPSGVRISMIFDTIHE